MPAITSFSVMNRETTPASVTFEPIAVNGDIASFRKSGASALEDKIISVSGRTTATGNRKVTVKGMDPVVSVDTSSGVAVSTVQRKAHFTIEFTFAADSTLQERKNAVAYAYGVLDDAQVLLDPVLTDGASIY